VTAIPGKSEATVKVDFDDVRPYDEADLKYMEEYLRLALNNVGFYGNLPYHQQQQIRLLRTIKELKDAEAFAYAN
jgi:hypothetical protein